MFPWGNLPGGAFFSVATAVSDDGSVVIGFSNDVDEEQEAFRWTQESGMIGLGELPGGFPRSRAYGLSADGTVVVGQASIEGPSIEAFRWTSSVGLVGLGDFGDSEVDSEATDVSADGQIIVGRGRSENGSEAFVWTESDGFIGLGDLEGGQFWSGAEAISGDGKVVVGRSESAGVDVIQAFRWTAEKGIEGLGDLPGGDEFSHALDVSNDGEVVVGWSYGSLGREAFRWTTESGMTGLGAFPDGEFLSLATSVSADGEIIVGESRTTDGIQAFVWTQATGMRNLRELLISQGTAELEGWESLRSPHLSSNGKWVVGYGINPSGQTEAYRARVEIESSGFNINSGLADAWFDPATNGQGFLLTVFPGIKQVFLAWFTYDTERPPEDATSIVGEPGHRWLTAQGPYEGDIARLTIFVTAGGVFDSAEPEATTDPAGDGVMTVEFADCTQGIVTYEIASLEISGEIPIQRITNDNVALCEALASQ